MNNLIAPLHTLFNNFAPFFILLGILIFVHEMGHFLVAKFFGVRVEVFSMGFGKELFSFKRGDTKYRLAAFPLGGYVKMYGDDPGANIPEDQKRFSFLHKPIKERFAIVLAGPLMNLFFAIFVFSFIVGFGEEVPGPFIGDVATESKAFQAGFRSGDKILKVNGDETPTWSHVQKKIEPASGRAISVLVERKGESQPLQLDAPVVAADNENIFSSDRQVGSIAGLTQESRSTVVGIQNPKSIAGSAGLTSLHQIMAVNGTKVSYWRELPAAFQEALKTNAIEITLRVRDLNNSEKPDAENDLKIPIQTAWDQKTDVLSWLGIEPAELYIYQVTKGSPAEQAGLLPRDKVVSVADQPALAWNDVLSRVKSFDPKSDGISFKILRDGEEKSFKVTPKMTTMMTQKGKEEHRFIIGIVSGFFPIGADNVFYRLTNPVQILQHGVAEAGYWTNFIVMSLVRLVQGEVSSKNIGGVLTIGRVASHSFAAGLSSFLRMMGLISINLFLVNLLPVPILDGGHLLFYSIEGLRGAPLSMRKMEIAQQVGLMLLMFLMAFAFFNDVTNYFATSW